MRGCGGDGRRLGIDSGGAIVHQIKVHLPGEDKAHRTIQTAVNEEVSRKRQHIGSRATQRGFRVVHFHRKRVLLSWLRENARQQLRELIAQDFNHPSVIGSRLSPNVHWLTSGISSQNDALQVTTINDKM